MNTSTKRRHRLACRALMLSALLLTISYASLRLKADTGDCPGGTVTLPFSDVAGSPFFCQIAAAYFSGLTNGTTPTTYSPSAAVTRDQMAAFITRTLDQSLRRSSRRTALDQFWTPQNVNSLGITSVGTNPFQVRSDGMDLWVANEGGTVSRVRASDGKLLGTYTGMASPRALVLARGRVYIASYDFPGKLYVIDPSLAPGPATVLSSSLPGLALSMAYDGNKLWVSNGGGEISIINLDPSVTVTNISAGFVSPQGTIFDGNNIWITDLDGTIKKLDANGTILQTIPVGEQPRQPGFDGMNLWVPSGNNVTGQITVIRASTGAVLATLTGNGLQRPETAAFDGERILVTNINGTSVSLWRATSLTPIGTFPMPSGSNPIGVCSDGQQFWIALHSANKLARF